MNTDIEEQLIAGMRQEVAGVALSTDIVGEAARRHGRRTAVQRSAYAAGVLGLAGALAAVVAVGGPGQSTPGGGRPPVASAESANLQLASAISASENISYKLKITAGSKADPDGWGTAEGAYDPATSTGYLNSPQLDGPGVCYQRLINGKLYLGSNGTKTWKQQGSNGKFEYGDALGGAAGASADPEELLRALRQVDAKITQIGDSVYHFESIRPYDDKAMTGTKILIGDVTLNADKRIAKVTYESTNKGQIKPGVKKGYKGGLAFNSTSVLTLELSDYGTPVRVETPTDVIVAR
ncbi:hypothetical protein [Micromonospora sp. DT47]|uniref:hypothetical protein n=1 Tax=Micromonospora sp. DT47 TaxID=3393431 RepID=UPI003CFA036E